MTAVQDTCSRVIFSLRRTDACPYTPVVWVICTVPRKDILH